MIGLMTRDDERREYRLLHGRLDALEEDIQAARLALERATTAHYEDFFGGAHLHARPEDVAAGERLVLRDGSAVIVVDQWQKRGLGTRLLRRLAERARAAGIEHFESHMIVGDTTAQQVFESVGTVEAAERRGGVVDVTVRLAV